MADLLDSVSRLGLTVCSTYQEIHKLPSRIFHWLM